MKISIQKVFPAFIIVVLALFTTSCGKNFSISNPDIQKLTEKAQQLMQEGEFNAAIGRLESINDLNPGLAENNYNLGIAYYKTNQYEKALDSLQKAIVLDNRLKDAYYTLAVIYEEIALKNAEAAEKIEKEEEKIKLLARIKQNYIDAKENYVSYIDLIGLSEERKQVLEKIEEFNEKIKGLDRELPEQEEEEAEQN